MSASASTAPILVAYDGSAASQAAVACAAGLFGDRRLVVATVWEQGMAYTLMAPAPDFWGAGTAWPSQQEVRALDDVQHEHALATAETGAQLARHLGALVEILVEPDPFDVADAIAELAERIDAGAIVIGTRGIGGVRSHLLGSTARRLLRDTRRPVVAVRGAAPTPHHSAKVPNHRV